MSPLERQIHEEIGSHGPMAFARFMELALYHPEWGYYAREGAEARVGRGGDFFTSVAVGGLFGRLLARQFADWWREMGQPEPFQIVEAGGLDGRLARDVLDSLKRDAPECFRATRYTLVEPLARSAEAQRRTLGNAAAETAWISTLAELKEIEGVIFGNELLDAVPFHRLVRGADGLWLERRIVIAKGRLVWREGGCAPDLSDGLPDTARGGAEASPRSLDWISLAARSLPRGRMLFLDYGLTDAELFEVERPEGTARAYRNHTRGEDLLADPGLQDLTAHVRWTPLLRRAREEGLREEEFIEQGRWLTRIVARHAMELTPKEVRQFQTLTHPEMLGAPFRVLVLQRP